MFSEISRHVDSEEKLQKSAKPSRFDSRYLRKYFLGFFLTLAISGGILGTWYYGYYSRLPFNAIYILNLFFIPLSVFVTAELRRAFTMYHITDQKIVNETGILSKNIVTVYYTNITHTNLNKEFEERIFNVGDLNIATAGQDKMEVVLNGLKDPTKYKGYIDEKSAKTGSWQGKSFGVSDTPNNLNR